MGLVIGAIAGGAAIAFHELLDLATLLFLGKGAGFIPPQALGEGGMDFVLPERKYLLPLIAGIGGFLGALLVERFGPEARGPGADAAINAFHNREGIIPKPIPPIKLIASVLTIGAGGSAGREGPMILIGGGIGSLIADLFHLSPRDRRIALAAGIGAGISAIFKAPLGGAILGAEILYRRDFEVEAIMPSFIASVVSYSIFCSRYGWGPIFETGGDISFPYPQTLLSFVLLGFACALVGIVYAETLRKFRALFRRLDLPFVVKPLLGGLAAGGIGILLPQVLGVGYGWLQLAVLGELPLWLMFGAMLGKIAATGLTLGSGGSGGEFAPALFVGGMLGGTLWGVFHRLIPFATPPEPASFVIIGMMALLGGISKAPLAVIIMIAEMTRGYSLLIPSMIATTIAYLATRRHTLFESQAPSRIESKAHRLEYSIPLLERLKVGEAMSPDPITAAPSDTAAKLARILQERKIDAVPIVENGMLVGIVATLDLAPLSPRDRERIRAEEIMTRDLIIAFPDENLYEALRKMSRYDISHLPVVKREDPRKLVGIITPADITRYYTLQLRSLHEAESEG